MLQVARKITPSFFTGAFQLACSVASGEWNVERRQASSGSMYGEQMGCKGKRVHIHLV